MSRLGIKTALARAVVDPQFRKLFVADMKGAVKQAGYDVTDDEIKSIKTNEQCLSQPLVDMQNFEDYWRANEERNIRLFTDLSAGMGGQPAFGG